MSLVTKSQVAGKSDNDIFLVFVDLHNKNKKKYSLNCLAGTLKSIYEAKKGVFSIKAYNHNNTKGVFTHKVTYEVTYEGKGVFSISYKRNIYTKGVYSI